MEATPSSGRWQRNFMEKILSNLLSLPSAHHRTDPALLPHLHHDPGNGSNSLLWTFAERLEGKDGFQDASIIFLSCSGCVCARLPGCHHPFGTCSVASFLPGRSLRCHSVPGLWMWTSTLSILKPSDQKKKTHLCLVFIVVFLFFLFFFEWRSV